MVWQSSGRIVPREGERLLMRSVSFSTVVAPRRRAIQYAAGHRLKRCCLWDTGSPGPAFAKGFGEATSSRARRSFSEGGKPGDDHKGLALDVRGELPLAASGDNTTMTSY
jgi:hypothetical protein